MADRKIGVRELIYQVKRELLEQRKDDPIPALYVDSVELELSVAVEGEGSVGINIYIVDLNSQVRKENTQTVKVTLSPLFTREEIRKQIEEDPELKAKLAQTTQQVALKAAEG
jgi:hypothetical protein